MILIEGRFNTAVVFTDALEESAEQQLRTLCNQPFTEGSRIRVMPDVHAGAGCTIGTTMTITDKIVPNLVGVDIGCGMETVRLEESVLDLPKLDRLIRKKIPFGFNTHKTPHPFADLTETDRLRCAAAVKQNRARLSVGTLGGGNHFIEANRDEEGRLWLVVHSGSRHAGMEVANFHQQKARRRIGQDIPKSVPPALAWLSGALFDDYLHDMRIMQRFAEQNRRAVMQTIIDGMNLTVTERFTTVHNIVDTEAMILRKGAVSAKKGEILLIPVNMRDGSLICVGKGNSEWNFSAPHGAGRRMSRAHARETLTLSSFRNAVKGVFTTSVSLKTLDEAPMAYKPVKQILSHIGDTVEIRQRLTPIYNFKAPE